jgi:hypothetical protein
LLNTKNIKNIKSTIYENIVDELKQNIDNEYYIDESYEYIKLKLPNELAQNFEEFLHTWKHYNKIVIEE